MRAALRQAEEEREADMARSLIALETALNELHSGQQVIEQQIHNLKGSPT